MRSRAYPAVSLEEAVGLCAQIDRDLGQGLHGREAIAKVFGYATASGIPSRKIAALAQFGLLERDKDAYKTSPLGRACLHPKDSAERQRILGEALMGPNLFSELLGRFQTDGRLPRQLGAILSRSYGISEKVADEVAKILLDSAIFAGILNPDGRFRRDEDQRGPASPADRSERQEVQISLSQGAGQVSVPAKLSPQDLNKLRKVIELLAVDTGG